MKIKIKELILKFLGIDEELVKQKDRLNTLERRYEKLKSKFQQLDQDLSKLNLDFIENKNKDAIQPIIKSGVPVIRPPFEIT